MLIFLQINVAKISNFANDIDAFVILSCPYGILLDTSEYLRPMTSLFEAEVAMNAKCEWYSTKGWTSELQKLTAGWYNFLHQHMFLKFM